MISLSAANHKPRLWRFELVIMSLIVTVDLQFCVDYVIPSER